LVIIYGYKNPFQATKEEILLNCNKCKLSKSFCNEDLTIKNNRMHCSKLSFDLQKNKK